MDSSHDNQIIKKTKLKPANFFDHLPHEISLIILSNLPITSLIQFSFTSRSSNSLTRNQNLVSIHLARSLTNENQILIFHSDYPIRNQLHFLQISDEKVRKINTPFPMPEFGIIGSCNSLLCLINSLFSESKYFYNPFTRDYKELPLSFDLQDQITVYGFGFHPITRDYKVVKISYYLHGFTDTNRNSSQVQVYSLSTNRWESKDPIPYRLEKCSSPGVLVNGKLHWMSRRKKYNNQFDHFIVSYDLFDDSVDFIMKPVRRLANCQITCLNGSLCAIIPVPQGRGAINVWIMKEYGVHESWAKEYTIGAHAPVSMISEERARLYGNMFGRKSVHILCVLKSGELLLEYREGGLVCYDPIKKTFKEFSARGMPKVYQTTLHVGSLVSSLGV